jgi:prepilin-type N-terminal cleavage/methylation domain-containing protein
MNIVVKNSAGSCARCLRLDQSAPTRGFTLTEILIATTILGAAVGMTMVVFIASLKRAQHTELMLKGTAEIRYAADVISQAVRSAPQLPTTANGGLQLLVPPKTLPILTVQDGTWIDAAHTTKGFKSNQQLMHVTADLPAVVSTVFPTTARPAGSIATTDVATYFITSAAASQKVNTVVKVGDTLTVPATAFGPQTDVVLDSISSNAGQATITFTNSLNIDVPQFTKLMVASGHRSMFEVVATGQFIGDLRYYPSSEDLTKFTVLAHNIASAPLTNPANAASSATVPFVISSTSTDYVIINLQKLPKGTVVGRTVQGVQTTVFTRNDPAQQ